MVKPAIRNNTSPMPRPPSLGAGPHHNTTLSQPRPALSLCALALYRVLVQWADVPTGVPSFQPQFTTAHGQM